MGASTKIAVEVFTNSMSDNKLLLSEKEEGLLQECHKIMSIICVSEIIIMHYDYNK